MVDESVKWGNLVNLGTMATIEEIEKEIEEFNGEIRTVALEYQVAELKFALCDICFLYACGAHQELKFLFDELYKRHFERELKDVIWQ